MKWNKTLFKELLTASLSFVIPFVILIIIFSTNGISLFNFQKDSVLTIDLQGQYIAYMRDFRHILLSGESLIYTTEKTFGGDYLSLFTYYLGSPFNLLVIFFSEEAIPLFFAWTSILKMALAGLSFYLFMRFSHKFSYSHVIFSIGYGLISYSLIYFCNYMWLDGVMVLPIVALGLHYLEKGKMYWIYPAAICYSLMTSWYIGFMICVFAALYFLYLFITNFRKENGHYYRFLLRFAMFSLAGGLLASAYWITAFIHLSGTKGFVQFPLPKTYSISMLISGLLENSYASSSLIKKNDTFISMFVGVVPLVFAITFFFNKKFTLKERMALLGLVLTYFLISLFSDTYVLMHGGREPTWFPYRYSFIIGFIICYIASKSFTEAHNLFPAYYTAPVILGMVAIIILKFVKHSDALDHYQISIPSLIIYFVTIVFASLVSLFNYLKINKLDEWGIKKYLPYALCLLVIVQIASSYRGADKIIRMNERENQYQEYETYLLDSSYQGAVDAIKAYDKEIYNSPFYRMEMTFNRPGNYNSNNNNPMFYSYNGLSHFSSSIKSEVNNYMSKIGFHNNGFFNKYDGGSTYSMNSLLGVKYLIEDKSLSTNRHPYFVDYDTFDEISIDGHSNINFYENKTAISLGFTSDKTNDWFINEGKRVGDEVYWFDHFEYQNSIYRTFVNSIDKDVFSPLTFLYMTTTLDYEVDSFGIKTFKNVKAGDTVTYRYNVPSDAYNYPLYFSEKSYVGDVHFYLDGKYMKVNTYWNKGIYSFEDTYTHEHTLVVKFIKDFESVTLRPEVYYENLDIAKEYLTTLKANEFQIEEVKNSLTRKSFVGKINIVDNNKDLIFTIPNEKGVRVAIDGKTINTYTKWNIFTAVSLSDLDFGEHDVTIYYQDDAFVLSLPLAITSLLGIAPLVIYYNKIENLLFKKRKQEE